MLVNPHGPARLELLVPVKKRTQYTVRVILGVVCHSRKFLIWAQAVKYANALPQFRGYKTGGLPPGNYVFFI